VVAAEQARLDKQVTIQAQAQAAAMAARVELVLLIQQSTH
jgi:hypothetical protein